MDDDDRRLVIDTLSRAVTAAGPGGLREAVTAFGWHELLAEEPAVAVSGLASLQGEHLTSTTLLDDMVLTAAGIDGPARVVYPVPPRSEPGTRIEGPAISVTGIVASGDGDRFIVPALRGSEVVLVTTTGTLDVPKAAPAGLDPDSGWLRIRAEVGLPETEVLDGPEAAAQWQAMRAAGHRALAHELIAIGRRMLTAAVDHVSIREQFGRKLSSFQAVKHALADVRVWQECAGLAVDAAWEDDLPESAQLAKILAGRFVRTAAANCQQVLGGMGFTWEHEFHRYLRRALVLEPLLGSAAQLRVDLGARLRETGVPRLAPL